MHCALTLVCRANWCPPHSLHIIEIECAQSLSFVPWKFRSLRSTKRAHHIAVVGKSINAGLWDSFQHPHIGQSPFWAAHTPF